MKYVKYVGLSHQRLITAADWRSAGINADTVSWSALNGFAVPADQFSDDQIRKAIDPDSNFIITDDDFTPVPQTRDMVPSEHAQAVEAPVDVVAWANGDDNVSGTGSGASNTAPGDRPASTGGTGRGSSGSDA